MTKKIPQFFTGVTFYFERDVVSGLNANPKFIKSKYFYDEKGDKLFQQIMELPEYYLTKCELELLHNHKEKIAALVEPLSPFQLVDLGAGDAYKTKILLRHFLKKNLPFEYVPVDISENAIKKISTELQSEFPEIKISGCSKEYLQALNSLEKGSRKVILFLGASIGNFNKDEAEDFLKNVSQQMGPEDLLITGFDLKKDPEIILAAYNDKSGVTKEFNLNLLRRINRELGANFTPENFEHRPSYHPEVGEARSALVSKVDQKVDFPELEFSIELKAGEFIHTEISKKYDLTEIEALADAAGFDIVEHMFDKRKIFTDSIWKRRI